MFIEKLKEILDRVPVINLIPILDDLATRIPKAWSELPDEKKQEIATNLLLAAGKAAANYAKG